MMNLFLFFYHNIFLILNLSTKYEIKSSNYFNFYYIFLSKIQTVSKYLDNELCIGHQGRMQVNLINNFLQFLHQIPLFFHLYYSSMM